MLRKKGLTPLPEQDELPPVQRQGHPLCGITENGSVLYRREDVNGNQTKNACTWVPERETWVQIVLQEKRNLFSFVESTRGTYDAQTEA